MIREQHGVSRARRLSTTENQDTQSVLVTDGYQDVILSLSACAYPAGLTPDEAEFVADQLNMAASRVREAVAAREAKDQEVKP